jgi:hypothetical protein
MTNWPTLSCLNPSFKWLMFSLDKLITYVNRKWHAKTRTINENQIQMLSFANDF